MIRRLERDLRSDPKGTGGREGVRQARQHKAFLCDEEASETLSREVTRSDFQAHSVGELGQDEDD